MAEGVMQLVGDTVVGFWMTMQQRPYQLTSPEPDITLSSGLMNEIQSKIVVEVSKV